MFKVYPASGRARCKVCNKIIKKDEMQVNTYVDEYTSGSNAHLDCINELARKAYKEKIKKRILNNVKKALEEM